MDNNTLKIIAYIIIEMVAYNILDNINHRFTGKRTVGRFLFVGLFGIVYIFCSLYLLGYMFGQI